MLAQRNTEPWARIGSPEINPRPCGHLIYDKEARIYNGEETASEKTASSIRVLGKLYSYMYKNEIRTLPNTIPKDKLDMD